MTSDTCGDSPPADVLACPWPPSTLSPWRNRWFPPSPAPQQTLCYTNKDRIGEWELSVWHVMAKLSAGGLTCPGWCWRSWLSWPSWLVWSPAQSRGCSAARRHPEGGTAAFRRGAWARIIWETAVPECTFCLLSSLGMCRTTIPSLRELKEMPVKKQNNKRSLIVTHFNKVWCMLSYFSHIYSTSTSHYKSSMLANMV